MRAAPAALLLLAACSAEPEQPTPAANAAAPATPAPPAPAAPVSGTGGAGSGLRAQVSSLSGDTSGLQVRVTDTGTIVELPADTLFAFDSADLGADAQGNLDKVANLIRQGGAGDIQVIGHTDAKGDDAYNQQLSERRAQSVANWFRNQPGIRQRAYVVVGKGEAEPVAPNTRPDGSDDPAGRQRNRRVEVAIPRA